MAEIGHFPSSALSYQLCSAVVQDVFHEHFRGYGRVLGYFPSLGDGAGRHASFA